MLLKDSMTTFCAGIPVIFPYLNAVILGEVGQFGPTPDVVHLAQVDGHFGLYLVHDSDAIEGKDEAVLVGIRCHVARGYRVDGELHGLRHLLSTLLLGYGGSGIDNYDDFMEAFLPVVALEMVLLSRARCGVRAQHNFEIPVMRVSPDVSASAVEREIKVPEYYARARDVVELVISVTTWANAVGRDPENFAATGAVDYAKPIQRSILALLAKHGIGDAADGTKKAHDPKKTKRSTCVRELLWNSYPHTCGICGEQIDSFDEMHVDHIIPLSRGGKDILANLQLTHAKCNLEKGSAMPETDDEGKQ